MEEQHYTYIMASELSMIETKVKKSRFIGVVFPVETQKQVAEALADLRKSNKNAKHIAYAYLLGENYSIAKSSDDGEPEGSAGAPIYQALREKHITNTLVAVVRYFGGIELGKSKLTSVYYTTAQNALNNSKKIMMVYCNIFEIKVSYNYFAALSKVLTESGFEILERNFEESMPMIKCAIPADTSEKFLMDIRMRFKEGTHMTKVGSKYYRNEFE